MARALVLAHRGASGHAYENSREAFRRAVELGADGVELDVHAAADGGMVVHHDPDLPGVGAIAELDTRTVTRTKLPNGETVPLLGEVLSILGDRDVWIEIKSLPPSHDSHFLAALDAGPFPARSSVHSFDHRIVARLGRTRPSLRRGILLASRPIDVRPLLAAAGASTLWQARQYIDRELVTLIHGAGAGIIAWTANEEADIERLVRLGVDGICGNYPERIRAVVGRMEG
jgi:glycerophosphoryl diester phosphodiesterase